MKTGAQDTDMEQMIFRLRFQAKYLLAEITLTLKVLFWNCSPDDEIWKLPSLLRNSDQSYVV